MLISCFLNASMAVFTVTLGSISDGLTAKSLSVAAQKRCVSGKHQPNAKRKYRAIRRKMSRYTWKSAIYIALTMIVVMGGCLWGMYYFIDSGYARIAAMQQMEAVWEQKAPLANTSTCDGKPCVQVTGDAYTNKKGDRFYLI